MPEYEFKPTKSEDEDAWTYKAPNKEENAQFKAGSIPRPVRKIRRKKKEAGGPAAVATSDKEEQHADTTASEEVAAIDHAYEEQWTGANATSYENPPFEDDESDDASSREEEQGPTVDDFEANLDEVLAMAPGPSLNDELGSDYDGYSDNGDINDAASEEDGLAVDPVGASPWPSSSSTSDGESSNAGNGLAESASTESARSLQAGLLEVRRECDGLKKEMESRDVRTAELEKELDSRGKRNEALQTDLDSRDKRVAALTEELQAHVERTTTLETDLVSRDGRITALMEDLASRDEKLATLEKELETREEQLTALGKDLESRDQRVTALEKDLESRDKEISALKKQSEARNHEIAAHEEELESRRRELESRAESSAALEKELEFRNEKFAVLERNLELRNKRISGLEAQNSQLAAGTTKTVSTRDSATNTKTSPEDALSRTITSREDENVQRLVTAEREQPSSPTSTFALKTAELVRFVQMCFGMLKALYLACISVASTASITARSFLSSVGRSESFQTAVDAGQRSVRASAIYLATPFWIIMSFAMFMSIWRERSYWVQANAVTRKHLLKHAAGVFEIADWEVFFAIGSAALT
ncbi:hypothetical protein BBK36DRAFT_1163832 [Trichoderma citrinoviride]|uniref:Uncharacterized protein n=1 Tax=Trichoderma citrinoviride TaxID=58853 RepID=A0A2T4AXA7_9HYPO|nr:hypothetical protein BBK36DRAFT_1163832 [Trichoderma citrinoviride]PTB61591.1 hypothetical protein BBK36DRAFT_1163832 [Trichoderma citrinoviride]